MRGSENHKTVINEAHRKRRRTYIINRAFQYKYAGMIALIVFLISSMLSSVLYSLLHHQARSRAMNPETYTEVTLVMLGFGLALAVLTAAGVGLWCVIVTHRICGPLFVLERYLGELGEGGIPKLRALREKDEFKDLYATFSKVIESVKSRKKAELALLTEALGIARSASNGDEETLKHALEAVASRLEAMSRAATEALGNEAEEVPTAPAASRGLQASQTSAQAQACGSHVT